MSQGSTFRYNRITTIQRIPEVEHNGSTQYYFKSGWNSTIILIFILKSDPPFLEVTDYRYNTDGTITLYADGVWPDYNSDYAFTNVIVVKPFDDGTFKILSNDVTEQELKLPPVAYVRWSNWVRVTGRTNMRAIVNQHWPEELKIYY